MAGVHEVKTMERKRPSYMLSRILNAWPVKNNETAFAQSVYITAMFDLKESKVKERQNNTLLKVLCCQEMVMKIHRCYSIYKIMQPIKDPENSYCVTCKHQCLTNSYLLWNCILSDHCTNLSTFINACYGNQQYKHTPFDPSLR